MALFTYEYREGRIQLERDTLQTVRALVQAVDNQILQSQSLAYGLATADSLARGDFATFHLRASRALEQSHLGAAVALVRQDQQVILNTGRKFGEPLPPYGNQELIQGLFETGQPAVSDMFISSVRKSPVMAVGVPVMLDGRIAYALAVTVLPNVFEDILRSQGFPAGWVATIFDSQGTIVARNREGGRFIGQKPAADYYRELMRAEEGTFTAIMRDGTSVLAAYSRSPETRWRVSIGIPREALAAHLTQRLFILGLGIAIVFAAGLALAWVMGARIARSIQGLIPSAFALGAGQEIAVPAAQVKEANELSLALVQASRLLQQRGEELRASEAKYRALFANMAEGFALCELIYDPQGAPADLRVLEANEAFHRVTGLPVNVIGLPASEYLPSLERSLLEAWDGVAKTGRTICLESRNPETLRVFELTAFRPRPGLFAMVCRDVTEMRDAEVAIQRMNAELDNRVKRRTAELEQANEALVKSNIELQRFAYVASHDLQTPLRSIVGFSQILQANLKDSLDDDNRILLHQVIEAARRMHSLIRDLLSYSRVESQARPFEPVNFEEILQTVLLVLDGSIRETGAEVTHGKLPIVQGDRGQLTQVLQNLIENAIKYHGPDQPRIHVEAEGQGEEWIFSVRDNGIGIAPRHFEKIFEVFKRLHSQQAYPGTGIGLAVCRRVIERHGGRVWVESDPGKGSTFFFSIPVSAEKPRPELRLADPL